MKKAIIFAIIFIPSLVFAFEQPAWQQPFFGRKKVPVVRVQQATGSITISKPLRRSSLKGFLEGEYSNEVVGDVKFQIKTILINSIVCSEEPMSLFDRELGKRKKLVTLISIPPIRIGGTDRTRIRIPESVMSHEQLIKLIQPSKSFW